MPDFRLDKSEKLCSRTAISRLFESGKSVVAYPLRMVYRESDRSEGASAQFLISIPKKKIRKAVGRVLLRRRIREAYRLNRSFLYSLSESEKRVDMAFLYMSDKKADYSLIEQKMQKLLQTMAENVGNGKVD